MTVPAQQKTGAVQAHANFPWESILQSQEQEFAKIVKASNSQIDFSKELVFANQAMLGNDYLASVAMGNRASLATAFVSLAATGLTLNPVEKQAYLVPRKGKVILDISYLGMIRMAQKVGAIQWAATELVYDKDQFDYLGVASVPVHKFDPFAPTKDRGELRGAYCIAKLMDGTYLVNTMSAEKIYKIRNASDAFQKKKGPWIDWFEEMVRKSVIRQAAPMWPRIDTGLLMQIMGQDEDDEFNEPPQPQAEKPAANQESRPVVVINGESKVIRDQEQPQPTDSGEKPDTGGKGVSESDLSDAELAHIRRVIARKSNAIQVAVDQGQTVDLMAHWNQALDFIRTDNRLTPNAKEFAADQIETILSFGVPMPSQKAA